MQSRHGAGAHPLTPGGRSRIDHPRPKSRLPSSFTRRDISRWVLAYTARFSSAHAGLLCSFHRRLCRLKLVSKAIE
nr:MAG TPA: hypothetical protein [Caudoviricetes sp.]